MPEYRVLRGTHRREDGTRAEQGETVELSEEQADRLPAEKFERIDPDDQLSGNDVAPTPSEVAGDDEAPGTADSPTDDGESADDDAPEVGVTDDSTSEDAPPDVEVEMENTDDIAPSLSDQGDDEPEASGDLPDEWEMLQAMAVVYEGDEVKGNSSEDDIRDHFSEFSDTEIAALKDDARAKLYDDPEDA